MNLDTSARTSPRFLGRWMVATLTATTILVATLADSARTEAQAPAPANAGNLLSRGRGADLSRSIPFDRITLIDNTIHEVEPISPRPLPEPDTKKAGKSLVELDEQARKRDARIKARRSGKPIEEEEEEMVIIHLLEGEIRDYKVKRVSIKSVDYFEDLLLADAARLIVAGDYTRAFERQLLVRVRDPNWRGLDESVNRLLYEEGSSTLLEDDGRGLRLLTDLLARQPNYPGLIDRLVQAFSKKIDQSISANDFFGGRELLRGMAKLAGTHSETTTSRNKFINRAKALGDEAARAEPGGRVDRLAEAARIWPDLPGLDQSYATAFQAAPTIRVAVVDLADPVGPFPASPAADRVCPLLYIPVLATTDEASLRGESPGQLLATWKLTELGSAWQIGLKTPFRWSDGSRPVSAVDVARSFADRASAGSPGFNARWADLLDRVSVDEDNRVEVKLTRATARPEAWLLDAVGPAHAAADGWVSTVAGGRVPVGDGPFVWKGADSSTTTFEAAPGSPPETTPRIRRIIEVRAGSSPLSLADRIARGEIDLIDRIPPSELPALAKLTDVRVGTYQTPSVHRLAIDGRTPALANRKLRRALSLAIDRATLLADQVLGGPISGSSKVSDAPFVRGSFVADPGVPPLEYNPVLAKGLVAAAVRELGGNPIHLTLEYPALAEARATVPRVAAAFRAIGLEVETLELPESALEAGLRQGRRFDLAYRAARLTDPLREVGPLLIPAYDAPTAAGGFASAASTRILQLLVELDRAPEPQAARRLAVQIDRESRDELPVIPLWQVEDHFAWRSNIQGLAETTELFYRGVTTWEAEPWFAKDP